MPATRLPYPCASAAYGDHSLLCNHAFVLFCGEARALKMLARWFQSTRLETRTKESSIYASVWVWKPVTRNESKSFFLVLRLR